MYDVIVIGAGPAGISASIYTKRANLKTLIIYNEESSLEKADNIENYYGFENGISGKNLYNIGINQAKNLGIELKKEEVIKIENNIEFFSVLTTKEEYKTKTLIFATGNKKNKPKIKGIEKFEGKGVSYCAICDGFFYRNRSIAVLGNGNYAVAETNELINIANDITILTNGENPPEIRADNVKIDTKEIEEVLGNEKIEEIKFKDGSKMKTEVLFIAQGVAGSSDFAKKLGVITNKDKIVVNENMETNIKGLFACGDCTGGLLQISKAVYEGTKARTTINKIYKRKKSKYLEIIWKRHKIKLVNLKVILCLLVIQMRIVLTYWLLDE